MSYYRFKELVNKFDTIRLYYGIYNRNQLMDLYTENKPLFEVLYPMYLEIVDYVSTHNI